MILNKTKNNKIISLIIFFIISPIFYLPQLFDGVIIEYAFKINNLDGLEAWYKDANRFTHFYIVFFINFLQNTTFLKAEFVMDIISIIFLILFCFEVKYISKLLFQLNNKWSNLAALFTGIFPVWHTLVSFNISQYMISMFFVLLGYRYFISKNIFKILLGTFFILLSFDVESNLSFLIGLSLIHFLLNKNIKVNKISKNKFFSIIIICFTYYFIKSYYFPTSGYWQDYNKISLSLFFENIFSWKLFYNILNFSSYLFFFLWIPLIFFLKNKVYLNSKFFIFNINKKYYLLILLSMFSIFPYLLLNKSSNILYLSDYYQRHAFLLAPVFGIFFALVFEDLSKFTMYKNKIKFNTYLLLFILINLTMFSYGNLRKVESYHFSKNLINEFKSYKQLPKGNIQIISQNIPADIRTHEVSYLLYNSYNVAAWWGIATNQFIDLMKPPKIKGISIVNDKVFSILNIVNGYKYECNTYVYLKNNLKKIDRFKKLYVINYKKYYKISKIVSKCL